MRIKHSHNEKTKQFAALIDKTLWRQIFSQHSNQNAVLMDNFTTVKRLVYFSLLSETSTSEGCKIMDRSQNIPVLSQTAAVCDFIRSDYL